MGKLRLRNPHSLCYVNAGFVSLLRALEQAGLQPACLTFALALCGKAVEKDVPFLLAHSCRFRELTPGWAFDDRQRDSAEYLRTLWNQGSSLLRGGYPDIDPGTVCDFDHRGGYSDSCSPQVPGHATAGHLWLVLGW